ncbi:uncharacterized, partial [Tachysurus ichikawai]
ISSNPALLELQLERGREINHAGHVSSHRRFHASVFFSTSQMKLQDCAGEGKSSY